VFKVTPLGYQNVGQMPTGLAKNGPAKKVVRAMTQTKTALL
jgi:hypothetical protein